jgi:hypothetical protein
MDSSLVEALIMWHSSAQAVLSELATTLVTRHCLLPDRLARYYPQDLGKQHQQRREISTGLSYCSTERQDVFA